MNWMFLKTTHLDVVRYKKAYFASWAGFGMVSEDSLMISRYTGPVCVMINGQYLGISAKEATGWIR
jgi:hypothetical protein